MKLNQAVLLSVTSFLVGVTPISFAVASQPAQTVVQLPTASQVTVAQSASTVIASGSFMPGEAPTMGIARIVTEGGHRYLELSAAFSTSNMGPDLHVLLDSADQPPMSYTNLGSAINLGKLHSPSGAQRYPIPDSIDLASFPTVVVWCRMANATFGYAPLSAIGSR